MTRCWPRDIRRSIQAARRDRARAVGAHGGGAAGGGGGCDALAGSRLRVVSMPCRAAHGTRRDGNHVGADIARAATAHRATRRTDRQRPRVARRASATRPTPNASRRRGIATAAEAARESDNVNTTEAFEYLDGLRESGATNMFGAAPYLQGEFGLSRADAHRLTLAWMETFSRDKTAAERAAEVEAPKVAP